MDEQNEIDAGLRVKLFVEGPDWAAALKRLRESYYSAFLSSDNPVETQAKARALDDIERELRTIVGTGTRAQAAQAVREKSRKR